MSEAAELLRRLLRQRTELGESELLLQDTAAAKLVESLTGSRPESPPFSARLPSSAAEPLTPVERAAGAPAPGATELEIIRIGDFDALREVALGCPRCRLAETRTHVVFGEGSATAEVVVVGEAPGADEDASGRPFVGRAGKLLDLLLASVGFPRESVFICNVLKCRPPGNRNPQPEEVAACSPYLVKQLELIRPRAIFAVGAFAAQTLLATDTPIGRLRGRTHSYQNVPVVPTYHPAALLRNPTWVRPVWDDLQRLRSVVDGSQGG